MTSASVINSAPSGRMFIRGWFGIEGRPEPRLDAGWPKIAAGYFKSVGIPLLAGREFTRAGHRTGAQCAIRACGRRFV